jgi:hypothetical protein
MKTSWECDVIYTLYIVKYSCKKKSKYTLWFKILVDLLVYCVICFTLVDFQAISLNLYYLSYNIALYKIDRQLSRRANLGMT